MATSTHDLIAKKLRDAQPGELIRYPYSKSHALLVVIEQTQDDTKLAYLTGPAEEGPHWFWYAHDDSDCISYGIDWIVEPFGASVLFAHQGDAPSGSLAITPSGFALKLQADRPQQGTGTFLIDGMKEMRGTFHHIRNWQLWFRAADRTVPGAVPPFVFTGVQS